MKTKFCENFKLNHNKISISTLHRYVIKLGFTNKKVSNIHPNKNSNEVKNKRKDIAKLLTSSYS